MRFGHRFESRYYQRSSINDGLLVAWPLDEASGTRYPDYGGTEFNLTDVNTVGTAAAPAGIGGSCASFNGSTQYLYCEDPFAPPTALSISVWCYPTSVAAANKTIMQQGRGVNSNVSFGLVIATATPTVTASANGTTVTTATAANVSANAWRHLAFVWSGTTITAYSNGVAGTPAAFTGPLFNSTARLQLGAAGPTLANYFPGRIAQPLIHNRAYTSDEIAYIFNGGNGRPLTDWLG